MTGLVKEVADGCIQETSVRESCQGIVKDLAFKKTDLFFQVLVPGFVGEKFCSSFDPAVFVIKGDDSDSHGNPMALFVMKVDNGASLLSVTDRRVKRTAPMAEKIPLLIHMHEDIVITVGVEDFRRLISRYQLGLTVPEENSPVAVYDIEAVIDPVQQR